MKDNSKRIDRATSRTAEYTCLARAISYHERAYPYKSDDYVAASLVPRFLLPLVRRKAFRDFYRTRLSPKGMYEYVIARTRLIDDVFRKAVLDGFDRILIFGAGFDSRGIRLAAGYGTVVFELDSPHTQRAKIGQLAKRNVAANPNVRYLGIDFDRESIGERLAAEGLGKGGRTLFVIEGVTMYLTAGAVDALFDCVGDFAAPGSEVIFDYVLSSVIREEHTCYGEREAFMKVKRANEAWRCGMEIDGIVGFLAARGFRLARNYDAPALEELYFTDRAGNRLGRINGTHCIAHAVQ